MWFEVGRSLFNSPGAFEVGINPMKLVQLDTILFVGDILKRFTFGIGYKLIGIFVLLSTGEYFYGEVTWKEELMPGVIFFWNLGTKGGYVFFWG